MPFEGMVNPATTVFGGILAPDSVRPGIRPDTPDEFRDEPHLKRSMQGSSVDEISEKWLERCRFIAQEARILTERSRSASTLARLAHAELAASDVVAAEAAALEALDYLGTSRRREPQAAVDTAAAISAAWVLVICGKNDIAENQLSALSEDLAVRVMRAGLAADSDNAQKALEILDGCSHPEADSLRGYAYLQLNEPHSALSALRRAYRLGVPSADVCTNLATAFWTIGSSRKAINFARQAFRLAPGRKDVTLKLLDYLILSYDLNAARREINSLLEGGVVETAEIVVRKAQIAYAENKPRMALNLLRRAQGLAVSAENKGAATEAGGRLILLQHALGDISQREALRKLNALMQGAPNSVFLTYVLADLSDRVRLAPELRRRYEALYGHARPSDLLPIEVRLAYLEGRFEDLPRLAFELSRSRPVDPISADMAMMSKAYSSLDWQSAAADAKELLRRFPWDGRIANNAAYIFVLAGNARAAEQALTDVGPSNRPPDYVLLATRGLIEIARQNIQLGLKLYRRSADAADRSPESRLARVLVTIYEGLVLQIIGKYELVADIATRAAALPSVALPDDWQDIPELNMLAWVCEKAGYEWPPMLP